MNIKKGDNVLVIAGKDNGKTGKVTFVSRKTGKVAVENINIVTKHKKPRSQQDKGGIVKMNAPFDASNVMVICAECGKATRVAHQEIGGKKVRTCKKCGASLDKEFVKTAKKEAKKAEKTTKKAEKVETEKVETAPAQEKAAPAVKKSTTAAKKQTATKAAAEKSETAASKKSKSNAQEN